MTNGIYLLLGSNLGDKKVNLDKAQELVHDQVGNVLRASVTYETAAWGKTDQPSFYNRVVEIRSGLNPVNMLRAINLIEHDMGRIRIEKWRERIIDIDILYYESQVVDTPRLKIPHPGIAYRRFTLVPLVELVPDLVHQILNKTNDELLDNCRDMLKVKTVYEEGERR